MPFNPLPTRAQNDALGPATLRQFSDNLSYLRWLAQQQHIITTGEHNAWEIPRSVVKINGAGTTITPSSSDVTAVTRPATGQYVLTLAADRFTTDMRLQINVRTDGVKPFLTSYQVMSATSVEVYIFKLSSTLGVAGNTWAAANQDFDVAIHSEPLALGSWNSLPVGWAREDYFDDRATGWNTLVQESSEIQKMLTYEHTSAGVHNAHSVAKEWGRVVNSSSTGYTTLEGDFGVTPTRVSAGVVQVTHSSWTNLNYFPCVDYRRYLEFQGGGSAGDNGIEHIIDVKPDSATQFTAYIFKWDATNAWWQVADSDFYVVVHGD